MQKSSCKKYYKLNLQNMLLNLIKKVVNIISEICYRKNNKIKILEIIDTNKDT